MKNENIESIESEDKKRTLRQNRAIHAYFEEVSRELNNTGVDFKVLVENLRVDTTPELIKSVYREIAKVKFNRTSTKQLTTKEIQDCYEEFNRLIAHVGVHVPFPSFESTEEYLNSFK